MGQRVEVAAHGFLPVGSLAWSWRAVAQSVGIGDVGDQSTHQGVGGQPGVEDVDRLRGRRALHRPDFDPRCQRAGRTRRKEGQPQRHIDARQDDQGAATGGAPQPQTEAPADEALLSPDELALAVCRLQGKADPDPDAEPNGPRDVPALLDTLARWRGYLDDPYLAALDLRAARRDLLRAVDGAATGVPIAPCPDLDCSDADIMLRAMRHTLGVACPACGRSWRGPEQLARLRVLVGGLAHRRTLTP